MWQGQVGSLDACLPAVAAQHRLSTSPGAEEGGWQLINRTGTPESASKVPWSIAEPGD